VHVRGASAIQVYSRRGVQCPGNASATPELDDHSIPRPANGIAQQTSAAITEAQHRQLTSTTRGLLRLTFFLWVLMAIGLAIWQNPLAATLQITNPISLWITLFVGWAMLWLPIMQGVLQGQQDFLWLGGSNMLNGMGRVGCASLIVVIFHGWAAGIMVGALLGYLAAVSTAGWHARGVWRATGSSYSLRDWLSQVVPLTIGIGTSQFMLSADQIFVKAIFQVTRSRRMWPQAH